MVVRSLATLSDQNLRQIWVFLARQPPLMSQQLQLSLLHRQLRSKSLLSRQQLLNLQYQQQIRLKSQLHLLDEGDLAHQTMIFQATQQLVRLCLVLILQ